MTNVEQSRALPPPCCFQHLDSYLSTSGFYEKDSPLFVDHNFYITFWILLKAVTLGQQSILFFHPQQLFFYVNRTIFQPVSLSHKTRPLFLPSKQGYLHLLNSIDKQMRDQYPSNT